jgi:hypothetical protein
MDKLLKGPYGVPECGTIFQSGLQWLACLIVGNAAEKREGCVDNV